MTPLTVIVTVACYFALLIGISWVASRGSDNDTFFTGNRKAPWPVVAFAMVGAAISGVTFISVPGMVAAKGYAYLQMVMGFIVGYVVIAVALVPLFYRLGLVSIYGYLGQRFGSNSYRSGAWIFFVSKMLGASVRFFVVCAVLQLLVFRPLGIPFEVNVAATIALIWLYTVRGGVKALVWTDLLKSACLIGSVALCIIFIAKDLGLGFTQLVDAVGSHHSSRVFFFDDPKSGQWFWKQFLAGVFMAIATNGLDQDMMQRHLSCRDSASSRKNMIWSGVMQFFVIGLFLILGTMLLLYTSHNALELPEKSDELFGLVASHDGMPVVAGIVFVVGLIAAAYSAAGSALTSLTTSLTVDILDAPQRLDPQRLTIVRRRIHGAMAAVMGLVIVVFYHLSEDDAISAVYTLASYTYGPILGLFAFGLLTRRQVRDSWVPAICIAAPALAWVVQWLLHRTWGYETGFELLIINAMLTMIGLTAPQRPHGDRHLPPMPKNLFSRYIWIIDTIRRHGAITRDQLNELWCRADVSDGERLPRRTFYNYRNAIEELFKINIECDPSTYEYYIDNGGDKHDDSVTEWMLNSAAMSNMLTDARSVSHRVFLEDVPSSRQFLATVINAIKEQKPLRFTYSNYTRSNPTPDVAVEPYFLKLFRQRWYVTGRNVAEDKIKTYALDRMAAVILLNDKFAMPDSFDPEQYFADCFGIMFSHAEAKRVVIRVEARQAKYFRALPLHSSQQEMIHDNYSIFTYRLKLTADFLQELLSHGANLTVMEPAELRVMITESLKASLRNYEN